MNIAILLSGGSGIRLGAELPKQYIRVADQMIITYSLKVLLEHSQVDGIVIAAQEEWRERILSDLQQYTLNTEKRITFVVPGITRQFSILNALNYIKHEWNMETANINVLIHDAARPNLSSDMIAQCMDALKEQEGVMPVLPMKDTIYQSKDGTTVSGLLDRNHLFAGQAPEGFRFYLYYEANQKLLPDRLKLINGAAEPAILAGMNVAMISGEEDNYKITTQADLERFREKMERTGR